MDRAESEGQSVAAPPPFGVRIEKASTGIAGLDELTGGGLPRARPSLVVGGPGCGKTLLGASFLVNGIALAGEPGVFVSFEEPSNDLIKNAASLGFDLNRLINDRQLIIDHVVLERSAIEESGEYDLEALFVRLGWAIDSIGAKRVVLDTIESLFGVLANTAILRAELRRLFFWLKDKRVTTIITAEAGDQQSITRSGIEEYVSDCVITLDHRIHEQVSTRRLRVVKYRGSAHGTNEYPFLIDDHGISVVPITSTGLAHQVTSERISSGIPDLDAMLGGAGYFRGSSVLISGMAGSGKSSFTAQFIDAACRRGKRCMFFAFEEAPDQIVRNMRSVGIDLRPWVDQGLLRFIATRPSAYGLEMHLASIHREVQRETPNVVAFDPISSLIKSAEKYSVQGMLLRLVDEMKTRQITTVFTSILHGSVEEGYRSEADVSSLMDTWLSLMYQEKDGEFNRQLYIRKSRGMPHSNQLREFLLTDQGIRITPAYLGPGGVLTGSARLAQEARDKAQRIERLQELERRRRGLARKEREIESQIHYLSEELRCERDELSRLEKEVVDREEQVARDRQAMAISRSVHAEPSCDPSAHI